MSIKEKNEVERVPELELFLSHDASPHSLVATGWNVCHVHHHGYDERRNPGAAKRQTEYARRLKAAFNSTRSFSVESLESGAVERLDDLLTLTLPFIEDAVNDPAYKREPVVKLLNRMRAALSDLRSPQAGGKEGK